MVTPIEGVIIQGKDDNTSNWHVTEFQVEYSLNNDTWHYVSGHGASTGQPQVNGFFIIIIQASCSQFTILTLEKKIIPELLLRTENNCFIGSRNH